MCKMVLVSCVAYDCVRACMFTCRLLLSHKFFWIFEIQQRFFTNQSRMCLKSKIKLSFKWQTTILRRYHCKGVQKREREKKREQIVCVLVLVHTHVHCTTKSRFMNVWYLSTPVCCFILYTICIRYSLEAVVWRTIIMHCSLCDTVF